MNLFSFKISDTNLVLLGVLLSFVIMLPVSYVHGKYKNLNRRDTVLIQKGGK